MIKLHWLSIVILHLTSSYVTCQTEDERVNAFLTGPDGYNKRYEALKYQYSLASWAYNTNITDYNQQLRVSIVYESPVLQTVFTF